MLDTQKKRSLHLEIHQAISEIESLPRQPGASKVLQALQRADALVDVPNNYAALSAITGYMVIDARQPEAVLNLGETAKRIASIKAHINTAYHLFDDVPRIDVISYTRLREELGVALIYLKDPYATL